MQLIKELEKRKRFLERVISQLEFNLSKYPEGTIQCIRQYENKNSIRFYRHSDRKDIYLSERTDKSMIKKLLQKKYEIKALEHYSKELKIINRLLLIKNKGVDESIPDYAKQYIHKIEYSLSEKIHGFNENEHGSSSSRTGQYRVTTKEGVLVKSKAEQIIADELYDNGIPFRYELGLRCADQSFRSPDFTIMSPSTGKVFYWEHFGMIDNPEYARDMVDKMNSYSLSQIIPGDNLILTVADERKLDVKGFTNQVRRVIEGVLR